MAQRGGDHGIGVDELTVKEERGEEKKGGRRGVLRSRRVAADPRWHQGGMGRALTHGIVPCTAANREEDEGAYEWGSSIGERERGRRGGCR